ncbi:MAG: AsnC family transcriptional regulator [Kiloniellales bacterium]|nr:AsnC family transcriptional regulator [Kiloniellales bacterium]
MSARSLDALDRRLVNCLQDGFPITERPFAEVAERLGTDEAEVIARLGRLLEDGVLSRFGPLYNVAEMGGAMTLAAMSVPEARFDAVAELVNGYLEVAHNYRRDHRFNMWFVVACETPQEIAAVLADIEARTGLPVLDLPKEEEFFLELKLSA